MRVPSRDFFAGAPSKSKRLVILLLIGVSKQELMIFFFCGRLSAVFTACTVLYITRLSSAHEETSGYLYVALLYNILWCLV